MTLPGIIAGSEIDPHTYADLDQIEKAGGSTTKIDNFGNVIIWDLNTTLTENALGAPVEAWATRTLLVSNNQAKVYSIEVLLLSEPFVAAKIVDDNAVTTQEYAISPRKLKSFIISLIDSLWIPQAWSKNRDAIVDGIVTEIDSLNPERLNAEIPDDHAVGLRILAVLYKYTATSDF
jgi:phage tail sheath gpL-like